MNKIMVVDDDQVIRELVSTVLTNSGFEVFAAKDGQDALLHILDENPDLAVVDLMMPNLDGYELCRILRQYYESLPILLLTAKSELPAKIKGFEAGADDYLTKPFEAAELVARVKALLRRYKIETSKIVQVGNVTVDKNSFTVTTNGSQTVIPLKEFELLFKLAGFPGRTFTRDQLIESVWGYDFNGNERTLDVHVSRLRERFPVEDSGFKITAIRGLGYRLEVTKYESQQT